VLRDATAADFPAILALNAESVRFTSPLAEARLRALHAQAACHRVFEIDGAAIAFLLALREGADYDSPNYRWFAQRYGEFLYIDRVVVGSAWQGRGIGALLYEDLFVFAQASGVAQVTCEFDLQPPNPASAGFHARFGFRQVGTQWLDGGKKQVSLQARPL
jgi:predicted GNAT superfamily acetyltransferase